MTDDSSPEQSGTAVSFRKDVGGPADGQECGDGTDVDVGPRHRRRHRARRPRVLPAHRLPARLRSTPSTSASSTSCPLGFATRTAAPPPGPDNEVPAEIVVGPAVSGQPGHRGAPGWHLRRPLPSSRRDRAGGLRRHPRRRRSTPDLVESGEEIVNSRAVRPSRTPTARSSSSPTPRPSRSTEAHLGLARGSPRPIRAAGRRRRTTRRSTPPQRRRRHRRHLHRPRSPTTARAMPSTPGSRPAPRERRGHRRRGRHLRGDLGHSATAAPAPARTIMWTGLTSRPARPCALTYTWTLPARCRRRQLDATRPASWSTTRPPTPARTSSYVPRDNIDPGRGKPDANTDPAVDDAQCSRPASR